MKFLSRNSTSHRLNGPLPIDLETGLYTRNFFLLRLKEERERSKRTGNAFSLLAVDVDGISTASNRKARGCTEIDQTKLVKQLLKKARRIDLKGWLDTRRVGILMPETKQSGALEVKEKICHQIKQDWQSAESLNLNEFLQIYTFRVSHQVEMDLH